MTEQVASEGPDVGCGTCEFVGADVVFKRVVSTEINGKPFYAIQGRQGTTLLDPEKLETCQTGTIVSGAPELLPRVAGFHYPLGHTAVPPLVRIARETCVLNRFPYKSGLPAESRQTIGIGDSEQDPLELRNIGDDSAA